MEASGSKNIEGRGIRESVDSNTTELHRDSKAIGETSYADIVPVPSGASQRTVSVQDPNEDVEAARVVSQTPAFSIFTKYQKWFIVFMAAWGGFFSPLSATIYLPALNVLASDLGVSDSRIQLTLTTYMIFQGLAPCFMGDLADNAGRRPAYIISFILYLGANIGLALQRNYAALLVLRCLQSSGSSSTIALASGVVADVATASERGIYMGWAFAGSLLGPALGPILGGILSQFLGWPAIFWFLAIMAGVYLVTFSLAFPETGRKVVGDGSIPPPRLNWSLANYLANRKAERLALDEGDGLGGNPNQVREELDRKKLELAKNRKIGFPNPLSSLIILTEKDVALLLLYNGLVYTAFYLVAATLPSIFEEIYGFNELQIGLSFLPYGIGCLIATVIWGRLTDLNFRRLAKKHGIKIERRKAMDLKDFPIEKARLQVCFPLLYLGAAVILCYGWALEVNAPLAPILVLLFLLGLLVTGAFNVMSTYMVDLYPSSPATATACNNLVRCLIGAAGAAISIQMLEAMGRGWCFTFIALVVVCFSPMLWIMFFKGPRWREERRLRLEKKEEQAQQQRATEDQES